MHNGLRPDDTISSHDPRHVEDQRALAAPVGWLHRGRATASTRALHLGVGAIVTYRNARTPPSA
jgi:hypothetical protein